MRKTVPISQRCSTPLSRCSREASSSAMVIWPFKGWPRLCEWAPTAPQQTLPIASTPWPMLVKPKSAIQAVSTNTLRALSPTPTSHPTETTGHAAPEIHQEKQFLTGGHELQTACNEITQPTHVFSPKKPFRRSPAGTPRVGASGVAIVWAGEVLARAPATSGIEGTLGTVSPALLLADSAEPTAGLTATAMGGSGLTCFRVDSM